MGTVYGPLEEDEWSTEWFLADCGKRGDRPRQSDLRESGAIEADADQVILLHQPDDEVPEIEVYVDKNRHGPRGIATLQMQGHYARLASTEWNPMKGIE